MSIEKVKSHLIKHNAEHKIMEFTESSATVELAARALGCKPERIAKSLSLFIDGEPVIVVAAGDARIDNKKYRDHFNFKAKMIPRDQVEKEIGHAPGGVCPFAVNENVKIYLDNSLKRFSTVFPAAGSCNSCIEVTLNELEELSNHLDWVDVCKDWV